MAGIGFKIQKLLAEDTYWGVVKGYFFSAIVSSGPWLISIVCIGLLGLFFQPLVGSENHQIFRSWVTYCYAASLVISGAMQVLMTRYLSDSIFSKEDDAVFASYICYSVPTFLVNALMGAAYLTYCGMNLSVIYGGALLYAIISQIWIAMIYLSAAKDFITIVLAYLIGGALSIGASTVLVAPYGLSGLVYGYTMGQAALLAILTARIVLEFPKGRLMNFDCFRYLLKRPILLAIGFFYNGAIWVDKVIFWIFRGEEVHKGLYTSSFYETPIFLAFVTIVPTLSIFLVRVETSFYRSYRNYYSKVIEKYSLAEILNEKKKINASLRLSFYRLFVYQGGITLLCIVMAPKIVDWLSMETYQLALLRIAILGSFLHALLMILMILILYFDWLGLALKTNVLFFFSNLFFTTFLIDKDLSFQGYGYFLSCLLTLCYAIWMFLRRWDQLEYITFTSQPLGGLSWGKNP
jgi:polysaccharide biosynthesis protein PelG